MSIEIVTSFATLMQYAHALGQARLSGDSGRIEKAQAEHDAYAKLCIESDRMMLHTTNGQLYGGAK